MWLQTDLQLPEIEVWSSPNSGHSRIKMRLIGLSLLLTHLNPVDPLADARLGRPSPRPDLLKDLILETFKRDFSCCDAFAGAKGPP